MSLDNVTRRTFSKLVGGTLVLSLVSPSQALEEASHWLVACPDDFVFGEHNHYYEQQGDEQAIQEYLSKKIGLKLKKLVGEREYETKDTKTRQQWIAEGVLPDIAYDLSYSNNWAQALKSLPFVGSELKINIHRSLGREDKFELNTVKPDYKFYQKQKGDEIDLREELNGIKHEYVIKNKRIWKEDATMLPVKAELSVFSRVVLLYQHFREFLSTKTNAEMPLFVSDETYPVTVHVQEIGDQWYSLYSVFTHDTRQLLEEGSYDRYRVKRVDTRMFMPEGSPIGIPDTLRITMLKYNLDEANNTLTHDHIQVYGDLKT